MTTDNKTLADVQPGGRVRLGDQAERARFEDWGLAEGLPLARGRLGGYAFEVTAKAWLAWQHLTAQPSPGGQAAHCPVKHCGMTYARVPADGRCHACGASVQPSPGGQGDELLREVCEQLESLDCGACIGSYAPMEDLHGRIAAHLAARQPVGDQHPDDLAVDAFAAAMKAKMAEARAKGRGGWEDPAQCSADDLSRMLRDHVEKGDPRDVANFCMMLHQRDENIGARQPVDENYEIWAQNAENVAAELTDERAIKALRFAARGIRSAARHPVRIYGCCAQPEGELHTAECPNMRHLAAGQPVGEPVGQVRTRVDGGFIAELLPGVADRVSNLAPLYVAPAQAVDLGELRRLSDGWLARSDRLSVTQQRKAGAYWACAKELRDWLDSQAVGNG